MNKKLIYFFAVILTFFVIMGILSMHFSYETPRVVLSETPNKPQGVVLVKPPIKIYKNAKSVWERSLFKSYRGITKNKIGVHSRQVQDSPMELIGICQLGKRAGAIIIDKGPKSLLWNKKSSVSRYYALNQVLGNGYVLKDIMKRAVRLVRGQEELILQLEFGDKSSLVRNLNEVSIQTEIQSDFKEPASTEILSRHEMIQAMKPDSGTEASAMLEEVKVITKTEEQVELEKNEINRRLDALRRKLSLRH